jgi:hypothetical protein
MGAGAQGLEQVRGLLDQVPPDDLAARLAGAAGGLEAALEEVLGLWVHAFDRSATRGVQAVLNVGIRCGDTRVLRFFLRVEDDRCWPGRGVAVDPSLSLEIDMVDFLRLSFGRTTAAALVLEGRLETVGADGQTAATCLEWFAAHWEPA